MIIQKQYRRVMLGRKSVNVDDAIRGGFVAMGFLPDIDLTGKFPNEYRDFNDLMIPIYLETYPEKSKVAAGLACGMLHTLCKNLNKGDIVMTPDANGAYHFGEITGPYFYDPTYELPHKRPVHWFDVTIHRNDVSDGLRNSCGAIGTLSNVAKHSEEIETILGQQSVPVLVSRDTTIEDPSVFALEKHLEDFLVANWPQTPLGKTHDIFENEDGTGQQFPTDTGPIDVLAVSKDGKELLVVELKKGRASDAVVGQVQRYMGYVLSVLAEPHQSVRGAIIALETDKRIEHALKVAPNIDFYRYEVRFDLKKVGS